MLEGNFYEVVLDNIPHGIYILDSKGNYIYVNSAYVGSLGMSKHELLSMNVHDFKMRGEIPFCISDTVYREKRRVSMIQEVHISSEFNQRNFRHLIISNPIFDGKGNVQNIISICTPLERLNSLYDEAEENGNIHMMLMTSESTHESDSIIAESESMKYLLKMAKNIARTDTSVLISGESGTGKEVIAQYIHEKSLRAKNKLVVINCASLPENLLEAELFGYEKGAFTGAAPGGKPGLMEEAEGGTLFLDEINSLPYALQGKLLRALETKTIQRIGATKTRKVNFRLLSATNEDLEKAIDEKRFRLDLFYRLNVIPLHLPPLRERKKDIIALAKYFLEHYNERYEKNKIFTEGTVEKMIAYDWPGNVRELKNFVERTVVMSAGVYIEIPDIANITSASGICLFEEEKRIAVAENESKGEECQKVKNKFSEGVSLEEYLNQCEREYIKYALDHCKSTYAAAKFLGTSQSAVARRKKKYSL